MIFLKNLFKNKKQVIKTSASENKDEIFDKNIRKKNNLQTIEYNNITEEPIERLVDDELPFGWEYAKSEFIKPRDNKLYELSIATSKAKSIDEEIVLLKKLIEFYYEYKEECFKKDECFKKYFSDMHMHCHNSRNKDFEFIAPNKERLAYIEANYERLIAEEKQRKENEIKKQSLMENIEEKIEDIVKNNPGILQSDLYQKFDPILKDEISTIVYFWARENKISREKSGRTYKLYFN